MERLKFRVECNYGSKYFTNEAEALRYYHKCKRKPVNVELWKITTRSTPTLYSVTQKLIDSATFTLVGCVLDPCVRCAKGGIYVES